MKYLIAPLAAACRVATIFAAIVAVPVRAQHSNSLTLPAAIELALRANPELAAARSEIAALEGEAAQAGQRPNPALEYLREGNENNSGATTVQLSVPIELGGKRAARRRVAQASLEQGRQVLAVTRATVRADTAAAYIELVLANEKLQLVQRGAGLAATATAMAARRVRADKLSPVEETRARVAQAGAGIELLQAGRDQELARQRLRALLPADGPATFTVTAPESLPRLPELAAMLRKLETAPALAQARLEVARRVALSQVELARRTPDLTLLVGRKREHLAGAGDSRQLVLGLSVPLPMFDRNDGAVLAALRRVDKAREEEKAALRKLRLDLEQAHARLGAALHEIALIEAEILPGARSAVDAMSRGFDAGKFSYLEVLDAQRSAFQSTQQHLKAVGEAHRAAFDIAILTGEVP